MDVHRSTKRTLKELSEKKSVLKDKTPYSILYKVLETTVIRNEMELDCFWGQKEREEV